MTLRIPYRDRGDSLSAVAEAARQSLPSDEVRLVRQLVLDAAASGLGTAGDLLDHLGGLTPEERGALVARTRSRAGMDAQPAHAPATSTPMIGGLARDEAGFAMQVCAHCGAQPIHPSTGAPMPVRARRWHCEAHEHLAAPGDMAPWSSSIRFAASGALEDADAIQHEAALDRAAAERRQHDRASRQAAAVAAWPAVEAARAAEPPPYPWGNR